MKKMMRAMAVVMAVAVFSAAIAVTSADAFGPRGFGNRSGGFGSNNSDTAFSTTSSGGSVLCCWTCSKDGQKKCGMQPAAKCARFGQEVSSCSECQ